MKVCIMLTSRLLLAITSSVLPFIVTIFSIVNTAHLCFLPSHLLSSWLQSVLCLLSRPPKLSSSTSRTTYRLLKPMTTLQSLFFLISQEYLTMSSVPFSKKSSSLYFQDSTPPCFPPSGCLSCFVLWLPILCQHLKYWCSLDSPLFSLCVLYLGNHRHSHSLTRSLNTEDTQICTLGHFTLIKTSIAYWTCSLGSTTHISNST